jgi:23S rRNA pseudouridine2605 synthase
VERLQKILSQAGIASRRASERLMLEGRVTVNGTTIREMGAKADAAHDDIRVDGRRITISERHRYILLNKPRGVVSTRSDPQRRKTVLDVLRGVHEYLYPVGRLDFDSEGLLLLTNDGDLAARLTHPRHGVARVYEVEVLGVPDDRDLARLSRGLVIDGRRMEPADVHLLSPRVRTRAQRDVSQRRHGSHPRSHRPAGFALERRLARAGGSAHSDRAAKLIITVREGRNRQVRRMCEAIGHPVRRLTRVAIGPLRDDGLKPGQWRDLSTDEVRKLRRATSATDSDGPAHSAGPGSS